MLQTSTINKGLMFTQTQPSI